MAEQGDLFADDYKIPIDGSWELEDLYKFPRVYEQVYFLLYSLYEHDDDFLQDKISHTYALYPWRGGYSAVNFYNNLKYLIPKKKRPKIKSMQYASLGWIEITAILSIAFMLFKIVKYVCGMINDANSTYTNVHKGMAERKLLRIEVEKQEIALAEKHKKFISASNKQIAKILMIEDLDQIHEKTGSELKTLKVLQSCFRRVKILCDFQLKGKTKF